MTQQLAYAHGVGSEPFLGETLGDNLRRTCERCPDREALVVSYQGFRATYRELWGLIDRAARALLALGVERGDRVGIWAPSRYEWVVAQYAAMRAGAILVNVNPSYTARELEYALEQSGVSVLIHAAGFKSLDYDAMLAEVRGRCPALRAAIRIDGDWEAFLASGDAVPAERLAAREAELRFDDAVNIQYTSGTTGRPKGATLSHHNILNNAWLMARKLRYAEDDRICVPVPFYHCFGMVTGTTAGMATGACVVVPAESFDPLATLQTVQAERCTSLYGVPTMFIAQLDHPRFAEFDVSSLRTGCVGGSLVPQEVMKRMIGQMNMRGVVILYGMTETSPVSTLTTEDDPFEARVGSVGRALPNVEIRISDPATGATLRRGERGEFCARGFHVMQGYWRNEEATRSAIDADGWMRTGDLATMDDEGYVRIVGRIKDMIIRGGENIYPKEVEDVLMAHAAVSDAYVIGVPHAKYGEEVMAWIRLKPGAAADEAAMAAHCDRVLARYKVPRHWKFTDEFPMTVTGKIQKFRMREIAAAELGRDEGVAAAPVSGVVA